MKIGYIIAKFPALSETFIANEVKLLRDYGLDIKVFSLVPPSKEELERFSPWYKELIKRNIYYINNKSLFYLSPYILNFSLLKENLLLQKRITFKSNYLLRILRALAIAKLCKKERIIHIHAHWPYGSQLAYLVHKLTGISYSISVHAHEVKHDNGHFPIIFESLSFATFCNKGAMNFLLKNLPKDYSDKCYLIYHGVDLEHFSVDTPPIYNKGELKVLSAGRFTKTKGFHRLIRGCAKAKREGIDIKLTILGDGALKEQLLNIAKENDFEDRLELPGWVPHDKVIEYIKDSHIFALLANTDYHDGLPNVVLEAMACKRPVIISPLPSSKEAIEDGKEGFILKTEDDLEGFCSVIKKIVDEPEILKELGENARKKVIEKFDTKKHIYNLYRLFLDRLKG